MGALKDRLQEQIRILEDEIVRIDTQAAANKSRLQANVDTLKRANLALTAEIEALVVDLQRAGIKVFG